MATKQTSCWLVITLDRHGNPIIDRVVKQRRPRNEMAIRLTVDIDMDRLQPHIEALVEQIDHITAVIEPIE